MPCVTLVAIMEELLVLGMEAVDADDNDGAVSAFSEALHLYSQSTGESQLRDEPAPLQSAVFRLLTHRSGAHAALGREAEAAQDAKGAQEVQSWAMLVSS